MSSQDTTTLNMLIATTIDSANGFEEAARMAKATGLASQFAELARDRWSIAETLEADVRRLGGDPQRSGTAKAAVHRRWLDLKNAVSGSDHAIIQEVENGETYLVGKYEAALSATDLSEMTRRTIQDAFSEIRRGQERVRGLGLTVGTTESARQTNVDWRRIGKGLGIAAAIGGAAFAASRLAQSRRTGQAGRRGTTLSIDRTDRAEIEARNAEGSSGSGTGTSGFDRDISGASSAGRSGRRRDASQGTTGAVGLAASGSTAGQTGAGGSAGFQGSGTTGTGGGGFQAPSGTDDLSAGAGSPGAADSTGDAGTSTGAGGTGGGFGR